MISALSPLPTATAVGRSSFDSPGFGDLQGYRAAATICDRRDPSRDTTC